MPSANLNGIDLYYERSGSGPKLMFLNGTGATLENAGALVAFFADTFDVVAFDQRGLGRSALTDGLSTMADLAADALALSDHLGWSQFRLLGISFGGMVAQELAVTAPKRIDRLALLCTSAGGPGGSSFPLHTLADMNQSTRAAVSAEILDNRFTPDWLASHREDHALVAALAQHFSVTKPESVRRGEAQQLHARMTHDVYDRLPRITCPTIVASGRYDGIAPAANGIAISSRIPNAQFRLFEGGHLFFIQDSTAFPEVIGFLMAG